MFNEPQLGENIRNARQKKDWTQKELQEASDISVPTISAYENNRKRPSLDTLARIAKALDTSIDELYYGTKGGRRIANYDSLGALVVSNIRSLWDSGALVGYAKNEDPIFTTGLTLKAGLAPAVVRLIDNLIDYEKNKATFSSPDVYLNQVLDSAVNEIDEHERLVIAQKNAPLPF